MYIHSKLDDDDIKIMMIMMMIMMMRKIGKKTITLGHC